MFTFIAIFILVLVAVDLSVRFILDPWLASRRQNKKVKAYSPKFDPTFRLATETMYDGGKSHEEEKSNEKKEAPDSGKTVNK